MKLSPRPILAEAELERYERMIPGHDAIVKYRFAAVNLKIAVRSGDKRSYDRWSTELENQRQRIDWAYRARTRH